MNNHNSFVRRNSVRARRVILAALLSAVLPALAADTELTVDCAKKHQTLVGFGTCCMHWTGGDLYTNKDIQNQFVNDLGASIIRFGVSPTVLPDEVADPKDISYKNFKLSPDVKNQLNYVAAIYAANSKEMTVIATIWSPPGWMKTNGKTGDGGNLRPDRIQHYAKYLAEWVLLMKEVFKTPVHAVSIQNELSFKEFYDSCIYDFPRYHATVLATCDAFKAAGLETKLFGPEDMTWASDKIVKFVDPILKDPRGKQYFTAVASHGYEDGVKPAGSAVDSAKLWKALEPLHVQWWMSETSGESINWMTKDKKGELKPGAWALASRIHNALVYGNASAWVYWCISGHAKGDDAAAREALMNADKPTKKYFISKQFYKFIRPGAVRVDAGPDGEGSLQVSSYLHEANKSLTVVLINSAKTEAPVSITLKGAPAIDTFEAYRTSEQDDFKKLDDVHADGGKLHLTLPPQSIVTLYGAVK